MGNKNRHRTRTRSVRVPRAPNLAGVGHVPSCLAADSFVEADRLFFEQLAHASSEVDEIRRTARANPFEKFYLGTRDRVIKVIINRMAENDEIAARCLNDPDFAESSLDSSAVSTT